MREPRLVFLRTDQFLPLSFIPIIFVSLRHLTWALLRDFSFYIYICISRTIVCGACLPLFKCNRYICERDHDNDDDDKNNVKERNYRMDGGGWEWKKLCMKGVRLSSGAREWERNLFDNSEVTFVFLLLLILNINSRKNSIALLLHLKTNLSFFSFFI